MLENCKRLICSPSLNKVYCIVLYFISVLTFLVYEEIVIYVFRICNNSVLGKAMVSVDVMIYATVVIM